MSLTSINGRILKMQSVMEYLLPYLPYVIVGAVILGIIFLGVLIYYLVKAIRRSSRKRAVQKAYQAPVAPGARSKKWKRYWGYLKSKAVSTFNGWGKFAKDELNQSVKRTTDILKTYLGGHDSQYKLPWYLMLGTEGAGKSTILQETDLELPIGYPEYDIQGSNAKLNWTFFDGGVVADLKGSMFLNKYGATSNDSDWSYFVKLFNRYRPKRPLDGIVITIPADELVGPNRLSFDELTQRSKHIYTKLWNLQSSLGMRIPVYVLITKTDLIPGFSSLAAEIPNENLNEMFGWSCPYSVETCYASSWVDEVFYSIRQNLNKLRSSIFTEGSVKTERDGNMLFPLEFQRVKEGLGVYLDNMFNKSSYHESFFLRGVYFSGKADVNLPSPFTPAGVFGDVQDRQDELSSSRSSDPLSTQKVEKIVFLRDLFEKKIFREHSLAHPIQRILVSTNRMLNFVKIGAGVLAIFWASGLLRVKDKFEEDVRNLLPALEQIDAGIQGINHRGGITNDPRLLTYLNHQAKEILEAFSNIDTVNTFSIYLPASWFSSLDDRIQKSFTTGYDRIILPSFYAALMKKAENVVSLRRLSYESIKGMRSFTNPTLSPAFTALTTYVDQLAELERHAEIFNSLENSKNIEDLAILIRYLFERDLPGQFFAHAKYYENALENAIDRNINLMDYKAAASQKLGLLFRKFLDDSFNIEDNFPAIITLEKSLRRLNDYGIGSSMDDNDVRQITQHAIAVADLISGGEVAWLAQAVFNPAPSYERMINSIAESDLLGSEVTSEIMRVADLEYTKFRIDLAKYTSPLTSTFFEQFEGHIIPEPSNGLVEFIDSMTAFLEEPFMQIDERHLLVYKIPPGKLLFWDEVILDSAQGLVKSYSTFLTQKVEKLPSQIHRIIKAISRNSTRKKVTNLVAKAQTFHDEPNSYIGFGAREMLNSQIHNLSISTPIFANLLGVFEDGGFVVNNTQLRELLIAQSYGMLERIERFLESDNLYSAREEKITWWDGEPNIGLKIFGVHDANGMKSYLTAQRFRVTFLSKQMAEPILNLLSLGYLEDVPMFLPLVEKWTRIVAVVEDYEKQSPGNSLKILEQFLTFDINTISLDNCLAEVGKFEQLDSVGDYFLEIRDHYHSLLEHQCEYLTGKYAIERFNKAATFFNANLAGRFPFTKEKEAAESFEADPEDVFTFFKLFDSLSEGEIKALMRIAKYAGADNSVSAFIKHIESIRPLMLAALNRGEDNHIPQISFDVHFRSDRDRERGGDKVIDWAVHVGSSEINFMDKHLTGVWNVGAAIDMKFQFASDADIVPINDSRHRALSVIGHRANFNYTGRWALIRLLRAHMIPESRYDQSDHPLPLILEFQIPTVFAPSCFRMHPPLLANRKSEEAKLYCRFTLHAQEKGLVNSKDPLSAKAAKVISIPRFPDRAPIVELIHLKRSRG